MEKHGLYQYEVTELSDGWVYEICDLDSRPNLICVSDEWFDSKSRAELAAIGHISLLENGEG